jgi:Mg2+/Co2+ transporter CorC
MMLDRCLGHADEETYNRSQIKGLIRALRDVQDDTIIDIDEANMMHGVLELHYKTAEHVGHRIHEAKMLAHDTLLDMKKFEDIDKWGHSRVFVFRRDPSDADYNWGTDIRGVLLLKKLLTLNPNAGTPMEQMATVLKPPVLITPNENLLTILNKFQEGQCHMAIVTEDPEAVQTALDDELPIPEHARPTMFCTLEDVIEELLKEEIYDEEDVECRRNSVLSSSQSLGSPGSPWRSPGRSPGPKRRQSSRNMFTRKQTLAFLERVQAGRKERADIKRSQTFCTTEPRQRVSGKTSDINSGELSEPLLTHVESC